MDINKLCPHCMKEVDKENAGQCSHCGYDFLETKEIHHQLKPYTILAGKYLVGDVLGEGGFGITYIGYDLNLEIRVAIKEFFPNGYATRESKNTSVLTVYAGKNIDIVYKWRDNFLKEARSLAKCANLSGVVGVKDFFQENNTAYIVQEFLEGQTLKEYCKERGGKLPVEQLLSALEPVILALEEVHKEGLIHRDISPDNIMLLRGGQMKLLDFGAARDFTQEGDKSLSVLLKPGYASEEQYRTKGNQGPWSDIYALAGTIYKCITGVTPPESMERMRKDELQRPSALGVSISPTVEKVLLKAMEVYAENRYQTIEEFHRDLYSQKNFGLSTENVDNRQKAQSNNDSIMKSDKLRTIQKSLKQKISFLYDKVKELRKRLQAKCLLWEELKKKNFPILNARKTTVLIILLLIVLMIVAVLAITKKVIDKHKNETDKTAIVSQTVVDDAYPVVTEELLMNAQINTPEALYSFNLEAMDHQPKAKIPNMEWDSDLFYQLEGIGYDEDEAGLLTKCAYTQCHMIETSSGAEIEYEIYSDPDSEQIYKITSLRRFEDGTIDLIDYYYKDNKPYFAFWRDDYVYTPSYASLKIPGTRFYFKNDMLVLVRTVLEDSLRVSQTGLKVQGRSDYEEFDYFDAPDGVVAQYDAYELEWLNRSYNTYEAIRACDETGQITGTVKDEQGNPIINHTVALQECESGEIVCIMQTDEEGYFSSYIYRDGREYQLYVQGNAEYEDLYLRDVKLTQDTYSYTYDNLILHVADSKDAIIDLCTVDATTLNSSENIKASALSTQISVRRGLNTRDGNIVYDGETDQNGELQLSLNCGSYTIQVSAEGYETTYQNIEVSHDMERQIVYMIPELSNGETAFVLTWDENSAADLDLMLFTPYVNSDGNMCYIDEKITDDNYGNRIICDNQEGCEVIYGNTDVKQGAMKIYVQNYTSNHEKETNILSMKDLNVRLYVYEGGEKISVLMPPENQGFVWEVASLRNNTLSAYNRMYSDVTGKPWWMYDKNALELSEYDKGIFLGLAHYLYYYLYQEDSWASGEFLYGDSYPDDLIGYIYGYGGIQNCEVYQYYEGDEYGDGSKYVLYGAFEEAKRICGELLEYDLSEDDFLPDGNYDSTIAYSEEYDELVHIEGCDGGLLGVLTEEFESLVYDEDLGHYLVNIQYVEWGDEGPAGNYIFHVEQTTENSFGYKILYAEHISVR